MNWLRLSNWQKIKTAGGVENYYKKGAKVGYGIVSVQRNFKGSYSIKTSKKGSHWHHARTKAGAVKVARGLMKKLDARNLK